MLQLALAMVWINRRMHPSQFPAGDRRWQCDCHSGRSLEHGRYDGFRCRGSQLRYWSLVVKESGARRIKAPVQPLKRYSAVGRYRPRSLHQENIEGARGIEGAACVLAKWEDAPNDWIRIICRTETSSCRRRFQPRIRH